jgi:hypothetical protein
MSSEVALTAVAVVGAIGFAYTQFNQKPNTSAPPSSGAKKGKKKKQSAASSDSADIPATSSSQTGAQDVSVLPGQFDPTTPQEVDAPADTIPAPKPKKGKKKKGKGINETAATISSADNHSESSAGQSKPKAKRPSSAQLAKSLKQSTTSIDTDGSWTRVEPRRRTTHETASASASGEGASGPSADLTNSDAATTTSSVMERAEDESFTVGQNRRTLAEKMLPKPRKTAVDESVSILLY